MDAKICATVTGATTEELRAERDRVTDADLVELRVDFARELDLPGVLADRRRPVIVTCRPSWAGGRFSGAEEDRVQLLRQALDLGAEYVDVEWGSPSAQALGRDSPRRVVLSMHDFDGVPRDLESRYRGMRATGVAVVKLAVTVSLLSELVELRMLARAHPPDAATGHVLLGMGEPGLVSRLLPDLFGSSWTYAGDGVAPGQVTLARMLEEFRVRRATAESDLYGVLGSPVAHSLSPIMHNAGFAACGHNAVYVPLAAGHLEDFERFATAFALQGASVTAPFKETVLPVATPVDDLARRVGAVNTLRRGRRGWEAINTDVPGFLAPLEGHVTLPGCRATVLGAGGAARAVVVALADRGAQVTVCARRADRAADVASLVGGAVGSWPPAEGSWDLLVNTTPIGTSPHVEDSPMPSRVAGAGVVYDLVYNPRWTKLLADSVTGGSRAIGGLGMLVAQAERQFAWWMGAPPPPGLFQDVAERRLHQASGGGHAPSERERHLTEG